ncbi:MAG: aminotransferase class V-fold PLP-dependent enzyme [Deferribacteraceae bacterium]|jgi:cysteine desulfurase|nr:aminotransferase class V-fold PLP-dependent enzyme [Deferribacteraceae bacterium]
MSVNGIGLNGNITDNNKDVIYFDNSATTRVDSRVAEAMIPYFTQIYGNPSSAHVLGREMHGCLDKARQTVAKLINCAPHEIIFMGCGTEADNFALIQTAELFKGKGRHIITSAIEHKAILETCHFLEKQGCYITYLPVNGKGMISLYDLKRAIRPDTILISLMMANNEVGSLFPIKEAACIAKERNILFHTDAVQAVGKIKIDTDDLGVDMLSVSGHKIYAPKGIGVLFVRKELKERLTPFMHGGAQEDGLRAGTENAPYIIGIAKAAELIMEDGYDENTRIRSLRNLFEKRVLNEIPFTVANGDPELRVPSISSITFKYIDAESVIGYLPQICCSLGSACASDQEMASHVLTAMKLDPVDIRGTIRFSFGRFNTEEEVNRAVDLLKAGVEKLRQISPIYNQQAGSG